MRRTRRLLGAGLALTMVLGACGDDDDTDAAGDAAPTTDAPATTAAGAGDGDEPIEIVGVDYAYEGLPDTVAAGTSFTFRNASETEVHEAVLLKVADGEERALADLLQLPREEQEAVTETIAVNVAFPAEDGFPALGELTVAEPGRYIVACFIPQNADPEAYREAAQSGQDGPVQVDGGPPHVALGMVAELTVE